jgi:short-subunit dehydrogenase
VVVASLAGLVGAPGMVAYSTTKLSRVGFAAPPRLELDGTGVGVTANLSRATRYGPCVRVTGPSTLVLVKYGLGGWVEGWEARR